jgi:phosphoribosylaminoimidazole carboxylase PurE protein
MPSSLLKSNHNQLRKQANRMTDVAIVMGSISDWETMQETAQILTDLNVSYTKKVISAHRMPIEMIAFAQSAAEEGYQVIIAGAGGAAHLPGMLAANTVLPVIGGTNSKQGAQWDGLIVVNCPDAKWCAGGNGSDW